MTIIQDDTFVEPTELKASRFITEDPDEAFAWLNNNPTEILQCSRGNFFRLIHTRLSIYCTDHWETIVGPLNGGKFYHVFNEPKVNHKTNEELKLEAIATIANKRLQRFEEAGRTLLFARHEKKTYGETEVYKVLKERGWKLLAEVLDEGGFL